jgi:wyosine [tRNA(Phe)-imidazoG37] synthetase (radical SAM superfamily)
VIRIKVAHLKKQEKPAAVLISAAQTHPAEIENMGTKRFKHIYGPVASRRLGRSLGIDLIPHKTCSYDCIYCQLGRTTHKIVERREYVPTNYVLEELREKLSAGVPCDYISLAGCGEPTLHSSIGKIIENIKEMTKIPVVVLTNGSLLYLPEVRDSLMKADLVISSLDAGDEDMFQYVNRPHKDISFDLMVNGLIDFTRQFSGQVWLEILLISGVTGMAADVKKIAAWAKKISAEKIQLNTVDRPPVEDFACAVEKKQMEKLAELFSGTVEIIGGAQKVNIPEGSSRETTDRDILNILSRRPSTLSGICAGLGLHPHDAAKRLQRFLEEKAITTIRADHDLFYKIGEKRK